ncbi:MAG: feruloyl-CoA synthase [Acidobacteria bacterium]|nr:feruloyl-CoA synthase [Acidobacteriota bacterium]
MNALPSFDFVPVNFLPARVEVEQRTDGTLILRSPEPLGAYARCLTEALEHWAQERPEHIYLGQRAGDGWQTLTYAEAWRRVRAIATALLQRELSPARPVAILSENSIAHALLALAAMHVGIPFVPISTAYSLMSRDYQKLRVIFSLLEPGLVFVEDGAPYAAAIAALDDFDFEAIAAINASSLPRPATSLSALEQDTDVRAVDSAFATITPDTIAKFLLTSGSTGKPKAVINSQRMLCSNQMTLAQAWPFLRETPPVLVDWLPWNHTAGGNNNFGLTLTHGGTLYIDEGKPVPGLIEKTVRNLREIAPTVYYSVPRGYEALLPFLENDVELRRNFFSRLKVLQYAGAALPANLWERLQQVSIAATGKRVPLTSGWGSTETAPQVTLVHFEPMRASVIGLPTPGNELKMLPTDTAGKYELRVRGPNVTPGYWKREDLTAAAFDEEGFYRIGDAGRFADPDDSAQGIEFAGRIAEDFKLTSGTWVHVGALRVKAIAALAPVAQDVVIAGHDRDEVAFLIFPSLAGCRHLCPDFGEEIALQTLLADARVRACVQAGMQQLQIESVGSSMYATRAILLEEPPQIDAGEITDKGYLNQRAVLERRASLIEQLYAAPVTSNIISLP